MNFDLLFYSIFFFLGIKLAGVIEFDLICLFSLSCLYLCLFLVKAKNRYKFFYLFFLFGYTLMTINSRPSQLESLENKDVSVTALVVEKSETKGDYKRYLIKIKKINEQSANEKALAYCKEDIDALSYIDFKASPLSFRSSGNPEEFDFKDYYKSKGISVSFYFDDYQKSKQIWYDYLEKFRIKAINLFSNIIELGMTEKTWSFLESLLLNKNLSDEDFKEKVSAIGLAHLFAISGLHISIIYYFILKIFTFFKLDKKISYFLIWTILLLYLHIIDYPSSSLRAVIMISIMMFSSLELKAYVSQKALSFALLFTLLVFPYRVNDVSLILSYSISFIIIILPCFIGEFDTEGLSVTSSFKKSLGIMVFAFPILSYYFTWINPILLLANLLLIPIFSFIICLSLTKFIGFLFLGQAACFIGNITDTLIKMVYELVDILSFLDMSIPFGRMSIYSAAFYYFILILILKRNSFRYISLKFKEKVFNCMLISFLISSFVIEVIDPVVVDFLDICQGDACLISSRNKTVMIDTGGDIDEKNFSYKFKIRPILEKRAIKKIDAVFISHDDKDHNGNLDYLARDKKLKMIYANYPTSNKIYKAKKTKNGDKYKFSSVLIDVISKGELETTTNDSSMILKVKCHGLDFLFTGDISSETENKLLKKNIKADVLKVCHHGSKYSSSREFLECVKPKYSVISCGFNNSYGHPHNETIERLKDSGTRVYRTDLDGRVRVIVTRFSYWLENARPRQRKVLSYAYEIVNLLLVLIFSRIYYYFFKSLLKERSTKELLRLNHLDYYKK